LPDGESKSLVARFAEQEIVMGKAYAKGFEAFKEADFDASVGDKAVRGIDREPAKLLDEAAAKVSATAAAASTDAVVAAERATWASLALMLVVAACGMVAAVLASRGIVRQLGADPVDLAAPVPLRAGVPLDQDGRPAGAPGLPLQRQSRASACLPVHAGLLRRVAHARSAQADAVRR